MTMNFEELDTLTRQYMLDEFETEEKSGNPYRSSALSSKGITNFPELMRQAILSGTDDTLIAALKTPAYWLSRAGGASVNIVYSATRLGLSEFNTWYVRGLAKRLLIDGETDCQVYRAAWPKGMPDSCSFYEGQIFTLEEIYQGHRAKYWPRHNLHAFSIPANPNCHHTIRRLITKTN